MPTKIDKMLQRVKPGLGNIDVCREVKLPIQPQLNQSAEFGYILRDNSIPSFFILLREQGFYVKYHL